MNEEARGVGNKATMNEIGDVEPSDELLKAEETLFERGYCPEDDGVNYEAQEYDEEEELYGEVEKAEQVLLEEDLDLQKAETILFGE